MSVLVHLFSSSLKPVASRTTVILPLRGLRQPRVVPQIVVDLAKKILDPGVCSSSCEWDSDIDVPPPAMVVVEADVTIEEIFALLRKIPSSQPRRSPTPESRRSPELCELTDVKTPMELPSPLCLQPQLRPWLRGEAPALNSVGSGPRLCALTSPVATAVRPPVVVQCHIPTPPLAIEPSGTLSPSLDFEAQMSLLL